MTDRAELRHYESQTGLGSDYSMKILKFMALGLVLLLAIILFNTLMLGASPEPPIPAESHFRPDPAAPGRLAAAVRFRTVSHADPGLWEPEPFLAFHAFLARSFPKVHAAMSLEKVGDYSLLYHWPGADPGLKPLLLLAHQDVVPVPPEAETGWQVAPFAGSVRDGVIWGRGAMDNKSGVMAILEAMEALLAEGFRPNRSLYLAFGHDEEIGGSEGAARIAALLRSRGLEFFMILDEGGTIVEDGVIPGIESPVALIGIAEKGYLSLELTVAGDGGHSSMPPAHTAVGVLSRAITRLEEQPLPADLSHARVLFETLAPRMGFFRRAMIANLWLTRPLMTAALGKSPSTNAMIRTTTAATMIAGSSKDNILPTRASAVVNFRILPGDSVESVTAAVKSRIDDPAVMVAPFAGSAFVGPSPVSSTDSPAFAVLTRTIRQIARDPDLIAAPYLVVGGTDAKHYAGLSKQVYRFVYNRLQPDSLNRMHGIDEQIRVDDYLDGIRFYYQLVHNLQLSENQKDPDDA